MYEMLNVFIFSTIVCLYYNTPISPLIVMGSCFGQSHYEIDFETLNQYN